MPSSSSITAVLLELVVIPTLVLSAEIPNVQPGDSAPPFVLQVIQASQHTEKLLKYGMGNESNIYGPIVFLAHTNRSGFLERLLSDPDSFQELLEYSPDNVNYVFLFYADSGPTFCNKETKTKAENLAVKFRDALSSYHLKKYVFIDIKPHEPNVMFVVFKAWLAA